MPWLSMPAIFRGARFAAMTTVRPMSFSGSEYHLRMPESMVRGRASPQSSVNCRSFLLFSTNLQSMTLAVFIFTLQKVSKSISS